VATAAQLLASQNTDAPTPPRNMAATGAVISQPAVGALTPPRLKVSQVKVKNTAHRKMLPVERSRNGAVNIKAQPIRISWAAVVKPSA
jgi:hypothetical protein